MHIQGIAETIDNANTRAVLAEFDQGYVVAIDICAQRQVSLTPFAFRSQASKSLTECLIYVQCACSVN